MFLREIVISGFKSFADRTKIVLEPGVTCIVGPNGCGKSNIVDAIRWVLGEQSAKALRGGKMQDVIFEGTNQRKAIHHCEVSLTFTDCEDELGTAFHEVQITRRASREGGSDYYLNGKTCRLKDIQRLFMDTGIGRVSYSFMLQGQIDQILSHNPAERRLIFEEAAGITKYKAQCQEAILKLGTVEQNLTRVQDIIREIDQQMVTLAQQARQAIRYQKFNHRLTHLDLALNAQQYQDTQRHQVNLLAKKQQLDHILKQQQESLIALEQTLEKKRSQYACLEQKLQAQQQALYDLKTQKEAYLHQAQLAHIRADDVHKRFEQLNQDVEESQAQLAAWNQKEEQTQILEKSQIDAVEHAQLAYAHQSEAFRILDTQLKQQQAQLIESKQKKITLENSFKQLQDQYIQLNITVQTSFAQKEQYQHNQADCNQHLEATQTHLDEILEHQQIIQNEQTAISHSHQEAAQQVQVLKQKLKAHQDRLDAIHREHALVQGQSHALETLQAKLEGCSQAAKAVLKGQCGAYEHLKLLTAHLEVEEPYLQAFEILLGTAADVLISSQILDLKPLHQQLVDQKLGRLCLMMPTNQQPSKQSVASNWVSFADLVSSSDPTIHSCLKALLSRCFFVEHIEDVLKTDVLALDFDYVVSRRGDLLDRRGCLYIGPSHTANSVLERQSKIKKLQVKLKEIVQQQQLATQEMTQAQQELSAANQLLEEYTHKLSQAHQNKSALDARLRIVTQEQAKLKDQILKLIQKQNHLEEQTQQARQQLDRIQVQKESVDEQLQAYNTDIQAKSLVLEKNQADYHDAKEKLGQIQLDLSHHQQALLNLKQTLAHIREQQAFLTQRLADKKNQDQDLLQAIEALHQQARQAKAQVLEVEEKLILSTQALQDDTAVLKETQSSLDTVQQDMLKAHQILKEQEMAGLSLQQTLNQNQQTLDSLSEKIKIEYEHQVADLNPQYHIQQAHEPLHIDCEKWLNGDASHLTITFQAYNWDQIDWRIVAKEIKSLRANINQLGPINLSAIEAYAQLKDRSDFLYTQSQDLIQARDEVLSAITDLNQTSSRLFEDTFKRVQAHFKLTFEKLFGGGTASLELVEPDQPLESGIEIIACPPGTKLKNLSLLSGGQKTMTAVALLFSIYQVKPSPFCVLDELDAPLDDANIGRFTAILREFTEFSQFLVISHNKRTIAAADSLYGVTMPERGVTQLVSLKFEKVNHL